MCRLLLIVLILFAPLPVQAQSLVVEPAAQSPHWSHINIFDYARSLYLASLGATDYEWYVDHLDAIEVHGNGATVRGYNSTSKMFSYWFDKSAYQTDDFSGLAEAGFLHFSENTTLEFWNLAQDTLLTTVNITGCPVTIVSGCRVQAMLGTDSRYIFNLANAAFRTWQIARNLGSTNVYDAGVDVSDLVWLDEHAPGFSWPFSFGFQTRITAGGGIKEYGGRKPYNGSTDATFEADYGTDETAWLAALKTAADTASKRVVINTNTEALNTAYGFDDQTPAINGFASEGKHKPDGFAGATEYLNWVTLTNTITSAGGVVDLSTEWCNTGPAGYTAGNYGSVAERFRMFRLASYYHFKEPVGSAGIVYFNAGFCSNNAPTVDSSTADQANWAPAYQVNVGQPVSAMYVHATGTVGSCAYTVYARDYTYATIFVRPKDSSICNTYDDTSSAVITFRYPMKVLPHDGNITGQTAVTSFGIRNAESLIAMHDPFSGVVSGSVTLTGSVSMQ